MAQEDFFSKSREALEAIATAFQLVTPEQAQSMTQVELAVILDEEQKKANKAEGQKEENVITVQEEKPAPKAKAKRAPSKSKKQEEKEKTPLEKIVEEKSSSDETEEKKTTPKRGRKTKKQDEEKKADEVKAEEAIEVKAEPIVVTEPSSEKVSSTKKKKGGKSEKKAETAVEQNAVSEKQEDTTEEKIESKEKENRKSKGKKNKKQEEVTEAVSEEKKEEPASEAQSQEKVSEGAEASVSNGTQAQQPKNKKQKSRHRSVEIRPAGEADTASSSDENASEEKGAQEGEQTQENTKPQIEPIEFSGVLEIVQEGGYGFVRRENYLPSPQDVFVPTNLIRRFGLRMGDLIKGFALPKRGQEKNLALNYITTVNDVEVDKLGRRPHFERLTPIYPDERFRLETGKQELSTRIIDLVSPIGKGQRGMIVSPPKAGKTILLQKIANAISQNNPKTKLIVLLIDERPEEVTDMQRSIKGEVVYSTFDKKPENHTRVTELVLERAMRLVEMGEDVVILLDSMTRLARAYNLTITPTGRTLSGGLDPGSLYGPKRFFGAARNIENGGSLTIVATSLIETGSRMDEVIFEEFKGTGNMEVYLDRKLSEKRIFPAIDINKSGTRREDLLMSQEELDAVWTIRKAFSQMETAPVTETIINLLLRTNSNDQFIRSVKVSFADKEVFDAMRGTGSQNNTPKD